MTIGALSIDNSFLLSELQQKMQQFEGINTCIIIPRILLEDYISSLKCVNLNFDFASNIRIIPVCALLVTLAGFLGQNQRRQAFLFFYRCILCNVNFRYVK